MSLSNARPLSVFTRRLFRSARLALTLSLCFMCLTVHAADDPAAGTGFKYKPKLYVLAVGVGVYQHRAIGSLAFAGKDAQDFAAVMQRQNGTFYRDVQARLLTDAQATTESVLDGLDWLRRQTTQHDVAMVFLAGHGVQDAVFGYSFLTTNTDPDRLYRTSVRFDDIRRTLGSLTGKTLLFMDTCRSAMALSTTRAANVDIGSVVAGLARPEDGIVVMSACVGREAGGVDNAAWGNGVFAKALMEGLSGAAGTNAQAEITHKRLALYVSERVKQLTGGKQSPVTVAPGGVPDYAIALTGK